MVKAAFIGLGVMGFPMAGHLARQGHDVTVYNRSPARAKQWVDTYSGTAAPTPAEASAGADFVFCCVGRDADVRDVTLGEEGAFQSLKRGAVFVDHTTASAMLAQELDEIARVSGFDALDAPVSGGQAGAEKGALTIMVGGTPEAYARAEPLLEAYSQRRSLIGSAGCGQLTKMVNQICIAGLVEGLAEGMHFAQQAGLDVAAVMNVISKGAAQSWQMDNRHETMQRDHYDFGFAVDWMRKDLGLCLDEARRNGARLPVAALVDQFYGDIQAMEGGRWDTSSLLRRLPKTAS